MSTLYERAGGRPWFEALVDRFYAGVAEDPVLRPLYPKNLLHAKRHLTDFLIQYWGGPGDYSAKRGHPRLRMRHVNFQIGWAERNAWFRHMEEAVRQGGLSAEDEAQMLDYFNTSATFLINRPDLTVP
ncbi:MAG TPA: globin [Actinomycetota bacterium]|nr:globin [Actinomycetota bacterium]